MKTAIIVHGRPDKEEYFDPTQPKPVNAHWLPWLKRELEQKGFVVHVPEMPVPYQPVYEAWKAVFEEIPIDSETILIGHSRGGGFIIKWLSEHDIQVGQVFLVAPSIMPSPGITFWFSDSDIDQNLVSKTKGITVFYSTDDEEGIIQSVGKITSVVKDIKIREFSDKGHFTTADGVSEFPELLEEIK